MTDASPAELPLRGGNSIDIALGLGLFGATVAYLAAFPPSLAMSDESYFLVEAARIRNGEVMYRDIFQFITPLSAYAMALCFWLFGTTIETARISMAVLHGLTVVVTYAACRSIGVRRELAGLGILGYLAISQPAWPYASWHWYSTFLTTLLLWAALWRSAGQVRQALIAGVVSGALLGVQQQKGVILAAGVCTYFVIEHLISRRFGSRESWRTLVGRLCIFTAAACLIVVPLLIVSVVTAGIGPVYDALIRWPLETYGNHFKVSWGRLHWLAAAYSERTFPTMLKFAPLVVVPLAFRWFVGIVRGRDEAEVRTLTVLIIFAAFSALSISYYPDVIHIAFIAPIFMVCFAEVAEWSLSAALQTRRLSSASGWVLVVAIAFGLGPRLPGNLERARGEFPHLHDTAFGRVAFSNRWQPIIIDKVRNVLSDVPSNEIYCYTNISSPYLTTGASNPTPYQFFISRISPAYQTEKVLSILAQRRLPYILGAPFFMDTNDPVVKFINANYSPIDIPEIAAIDELSGLILYGRNDLPPGVQPHPIAIDATEN